MYTILECIPDWSSDTVMFTLDEGVEDQYVLLEYTIDYDEVCEWRWSGSHEYEECEMVALLDRVKRCYLVQANGGVKDDTILDREYPLEDDYDDSLKEALNEQHDKFLAEQENW
jgi:hypothetical protein